MKKTSLILIFFFISHLSLFSQIQQSTCRNNVNKIIVEPLLNYDSIVISNGNGCLVTDLNVIIDTVLHTWDADLNFYIQKGNIGSLIINHAGSSGDNFIHTKLDDSASIQITSGTAPFNGSFRPSNPLAPFNGISTNGSWKLLITDTAGGDTGMLKAWCIQLSFTCPTGGIQTVEIPNSYRLYQNYPNPFNPVTKIKYGLPKNSLVKLAVYNELGEEVALLVNSFKAADTYEAVFDASNLPSGVYYYKLEAEGFTDTKKMVILK